MNVQRHSISVCDGVTTANKNIESPMRLFHDNKASVVRVNGNCYVFTSVYTTRSLQNYWLVKNGIPVEKQDVFAKNLETRRKREMVKCFSRSAYESEYILRTISSKFFVPAFEHRLMN